MRYRARSMLLATICALLGMSAALAGGSDALERIQAGDCQGAGDAINQGIERQDALAYLAAGYLYDLTGCVAHDAARAARYYRLAADLGNSDAVQLLGLIYALGNGVPQDYRAAYRAFTYVRAKDPGFKPARDEIQAATGYAWAVTQIARGKAKYPSTPFGRKEGKILVTFHVATREVSFDTAGFPDSSAFRQMIRDAYDLAVKEAPPLGPEVMQDVDFETPWKFELR